MVLFSIMMDPMTESTVILRLINELYRRNAFTQSQNLFRRDNAARYSGECDHFIANLTRSGGALALFSNVKTCEATLNGVSIGGVAEILYRYIASQPEPLFSSALYDSFVVADAIKDENDRYVAYCTLFNQVPVGFRTDSSRLLDCLVTIHQNSSVTKDDANSLADVFAPLFLRPAAARPYMAGDSKILRNIIYTLIAHPDVTWKRAKDASCQLKSSQKPSDPSLPPPPFAVRPILPPEPEAAKPAVPEATSQPDTRPRVDSAAQSDGQTEGQKNLFVMSKKPSPQQQPGGRTIALSSQRVFVTPFFYTDLHTHNTDIVVLFVHFLFFFFSKTEKQQWS